MICQLLLCVSDVCFGVLECWSEAGDGSVTARLGAPAALGVPVLAFLDLPSLKLSSFEKGETAIWYMTMENSTILILLLSFMFPMQLISYEWWYVMHALTSKAWQVFLVDFQLTASTYRLSELEKKVLLYYLFRCKEHMTRIPYKINRFQPWLRSFLKPYYQLHWILWYPRYS